jgi:cytochrome b561
MSSASRARVGAQCAPESASRLKKGGADHVYTTTAVALHWVIAALIAGGFALGWTMTRIPGITPEKLRFYSWHKWIGVTVLALALIRIVWRATHRTPPLPENMSARQQWSAHAVHVALYLLMIAIPVSGYLYSSAANVPVVYLGVVPLPTLITPDPTLKAWLKTVHIALDYGMFVLVLGHAAAAVKHQWIDRDGLLRRMLPFLK